MLRGIGLIDRVNGLQQGAPATVKHFSKEGKVFYISVCLCILCLILTGRKPSSLKNLSVGPGEGSVVATFVANNTKFDRNENSLVQCQLILDHESLLI